MSLAFSEFEGLMAIAENMGCDEDCKRDAEADAEEKQLEKDLKIQARHEQANTEHSARKNLTAASSSTQEVSASLPFPHAPKHV